jgi:hypothetical protein
MPPLFQAARSLARPKEISASIQSSFTMSVELDGQSAEYSRVARIASGAWSRSSSS